jgi:hypothetical protein
MRSPRATDWCAFRFTLAAIAQCGAVRAIRHYLAGERGLPPDPAYLGGYWRLGGSIGEEGARGPVRDERGFGNVAAAVQDRFARDLGRDLADGTWDGRHGRLRTQPAFDGSLILAISD